MTKDFEFFHGVVFSRIIHGSRCPVTIRPFQSASNSSYILNESIGIYIKYSSKRMTPWRFTFTKDHQDEIGLMKSVCKSVFLVLVCNDDGIVCLSYPELRQILDDQHAPIEWISATRQKRKMYAVKGSDGELDFKVGQSAFPERIFTVD